MAAPTAGPRPLAASLLLDALTEFERVLDALPAPGRGGAIGRLNPGAVTVLHVARDTTFLGAFAHLGPPDPWVVERLNESAPPPHFAEARDALTRARTRLTPYLEGATSEQMAEIAVKEPTPGLPDHLVGQRMEYLVARTAAHVFAHAGEASALASLVGAPDLGLPGDMDATRGSSG